MGEGYFDKTELLFRTADVDLRVNTSYPVFPSGFRKYQSDEDLFSGVKDLSLYVHIPFCDRLCAFCEYTRFLAVGKDEDVYLSLLEQQVRGYLSEHLVDRIYGLDIGGGTPTVLNDENFRRLMEIQNALCSAGTTLPDFRKSIEGTFATLTEDKIRMIAEYGFRRVSAGMQTCSAAILAENNREAASYDEMMRVRSLIADAEIDRFNIDLMYGLPHLSDDDIRATVDMIRRLSPEEVTLYETRFNQNHMLEDGITRDQQYHQYSLYYDLLTDAGYHGVFGRNTFSKFENETGTSSYLQYRMRDNVPYKGFGISAQSMSPCGISYGSLKNTNNARMPELKQITEQDNYRLPPDELAAKYVSIALYSGAFRLSVLQDIIKADPFDVYGVEMDYLFENGFVRQSGDMIRLTKTGFRYYGAIAALFWSDEQKRLLLKENANGL